MTALSSTPPRRFVRRLLVLIGATLIASCAVKDPPDLATIRKETAIPVPLGFTTTGPAAGLVVGNWIASFGDEQLTAAVAEGIARNPDLQSGAARVESAMLSAKMAGAKLWPS